VHDSSAVNQEPQAIPLGGLRFCFSGIALSHRLVAPPPIPAEKGEGPVLVEL
jgi:hypothetical protein